MPICIGHLQCNDYSVSQWGHEEEVIADVLKELLTKDVKSWLLFGHTVVSDSLWPRGLQLAMSPCHSLSPRVWPSLCPLDWWYHPAISSSDDTFSCPQSSPASGTFPMGWLFASGDRPQELQLQHQWSIPLHFSEYSGLIPLKNDYDTNKNNNSALITGDCPGTLVAKTACSQCREARFDPWSGNCIPYASAKNHTCHNLDLMQPNK